MHERGSSSLGRWHEINLAYSFYYTLNLYQAHIFITFPLSLSTYHIRILTVFYIILNSYPAFSLGYRNLLASGSVKPVNRQV
ncbi:hypothetical protein F4811DRAFT_506343 [Daldinia bambusicola]|nr:hypothetical protein F4811DRAFT_506343 [Daldinia bambusicola]